MADKIVHSYAGRYQWEVGRDTVNRIVPANMALSKLNPYVPTLSTSYDTYYTLDGAYVGGTRGGAIRVYDDGTPFDWTTLEKRTIYVRTIPDANDPKRYEPLQPMRDNYAEYQKGVTTEGFLAYELAALQNLAVDYYNEFAATAQALGEDVKRASIVDGIGVLLTTAGTATTATGIGAAVAGLGWITQLLSGKKKLTKELQETITAGQKDLTEISTIYNVYAPKNTIEKYLPWVGAVALGLIVYLNYKKEKS